MTQVTLYADVLFLVNFMMNTFVLWVVAKVVRLGPAHRRPGLWRAIAGAVMALLYTLWRVAPVLQGVRPVVASIVILLVGVAIAFLPKRLGAVVKTMAVAYVVSFTIGGLGMSLGLSLATADAPLDFSWQWVAVGAVCSYVLIKLGLKIAAKGVLSKEVLAPVAITLDGKEAVFTALVDTGHHLTDPLTNAPVIIAPLEMFPTLNGVTGAMLSARPPGVACNIRLIPFKSLGCPQGVLTAFVPDKITINHHPVPHALVALYPHPLCNDNRFQGIISPHIAPPAA